MLSRFVFLCCTLGALLSSSLVLLVVGTRFTLRSVRLDELDRVLVDGFASSRRTFGALRVSTRVVGLRELRVLSMTVALRCSSRFLFIALTSETRVRTDEDADDLLDCLEGAATLVPDNARLLAGDDRV